jgi:hypothetical protein
VFTNDTFVANIAPRGLGGVIVLFGNGGSLQNLTFAGNQGAGGSGYFGAAIAGGTALNITNTLFSALGIGRNCPTSDQRGTARPPNGCSAGAVEGGNVP